MLISKDENLLIMEKKEEKNKECKNLTPEEMELVAGGHIRRVNVDATRRKSGSAGVGSKCASSKKKDCESAECEWKNNSCQPKWVKSN